GGGIAVAGACGGGASERRRELRRALEAVGIGRAGWASVRSVRQNGVLLEFLSLLPTSFVDAPARYSAATIAEAVRRYLSADAGQDGGVGPETADVTVIAYMIESLMDPADLGIPVTADPIPTLHAPADAHPPRSA